MKQENKRWRFTTNQLLSNLEAMRQSWRASGEEHDIIRLVMADLRDRLEWMDREEEESRVRKLDGEIKTPS